MSKINWIMVFALVFCLPAFGQDSTYLRFVLQGYEPLSSSSLKQAFQLDSGSIISLQETHHGGSSRKINLYDQLGNLIHFRGVDSGLTLASQEIYGKRLGKIGANHFFYSSWGWPDTSKKLIGTTEIMDQNLKVLRAKYDSTYYLDIVNVRADTIVGLYYNQGYSLRKELINGTLLWERDLDTLYKRYSEDTAQLKPQSIQFDGRRIYVISSISDSSGALGAYSVFDKSGSLISQKFYAERETLPNQSNKSIRYQFLKDYDVLITTTGGGSYGRYWDKTHLQVSDKNGTKLYEYNTPKEYSEYLVNLIQMDSLIVQNYEITDPDSNFCISKAALIRYTNPSGTIQRQNMYRFEKGYFWINPIHKSTSGGIIASAHLHIDYYIGGSYLICLDSIGSAQADISGPNGIKLNPPPSTLPDSCWRYNFTEEIFTQERISLFPNPANTQVALSGYNQEKNVQIEIFNMSGQLVKSASSRAIDVSDLNKGLYLVRVEQGKQLQLIKLVINN